MSEHHPDACNSPHSLIREQMTLLRLDVAEMVLERQKTGKSQLEDQLQLVNL